MRSLNACVINHCCSRQPVALLRLSRTVSTQAQEQGLHMAPRLAEEAELFKMTMVLCMLCVK